LDMLFAPKAQEPETSPEPKLVDLPLATEVVQ
jgi:hypothetical protein